MANADRCVSCGEIIPEGRLICPNCFATVKREKEGETDGGEKQLIYKDDARAAVLNVDPAVAFCIDRVKPVDAVEVVRCKDCVFAEPNDASDNYVNCNQLFGMAMSKDGYCADGERKDNGTLLL